jgi:release factor glutamine methyltransferase
MRLLGNVLKLATSLLEQKQVSLPRRSAEELLAHVLGCKRLDLYLSFDQPLMEKELDLFRVLIKRRMTHEPLQYIVGEVEFYGVEIEVNKTVLIPRQETEEMLDLIVKRLAYEEMASKKVLDLCTGSGCIAIAFKKRFPIAEVWGVDISSDALLLAQKNSIKNDVKIFWAVSDLVSTVKEKYDIVICNPPYVGEEEYLTLGTEVHHEPRGALVGKEGGIGFYKRLANELPQILNPRAKIFFEIGYRQKEGILACFSDPWWKEKAVKTDLSSRDRFFFLEFE